ncbi:proteasome subunit beta [Candidatus Woesearchaeota archaeon]|nr:proteasome subunit beta [Candidatus Woesearchaeota archaeon]
MSENQSDLMKTGTTTVALVCKDGLVLAADMRATAGSLIVNKKTDKIIPIADNMIVTMAGTVSDAQLMARLIKAEISLKKIRSGFEPNVKESANLLAGLVYGNIRRMSMIPGISHFILGGKDSTGFYVYDIFPDGSLTLVDDYVSSGSGSVFAYGVLENGYDSNLSVDEGVNLVVKAVNAALQRDTYSGNGINVVTITKKGVKKVVEKILNTQLTI